LIETEERELPGTSSSRKQYPPAYRLQAWSHTFWQFFRYCLVGGANTAIDLAVFNILLWCLPTSNALVLAAYNSVAYASGAVSSFFLNKYWTFRHRQSTTRGEVLRFVIILLVEVLLSNVLVWLAGLALQPLITNTELWGNASKLVAVLGGVLISYIGMRCWIFAGRSRARSKK